MASYSVNSKRAKAITAMMTARTIHDAAKVAGIGERTLHKWLHEAEFREALQAAQAQAIEATVRRLSELTGLATDVLRDLLKSKTTTDVVKLRAADITLARFGLLAEAQEWEQRLAALEAILKSREALTP